MQRYIEIGRGRDYEFKKRLEDLLGEYSMFWELSVHQPFGDEAEKEYNPKRFLRYAEYFIADVSEPSMEIGIEIGYAVACGAIVICLNRAGTKPPESLKTVTKHFIRYRTEKSMLNNIIKCIREIEGDCW